MGMSLPHIDKNEKSNYSRRGRSRFRIVRGPIFEQIPVTNPIHKIPLVFFKYGLGFVSYGVKKDSFGFCHIWVGFVIYGVSKDTFGFLQIWVGFCHLWGEEGFSLVVSYMGGF